MKVSFNRSALAEALALVGSVVPSRTPKPILRCVRINAADKEVTVSATDLEVGLNYVLSQVEVERGGDLVVEADRLTAIVRESVDDVLVLEAQETSCEIRGADSRFKIYGQDPKQYPAVRSLASGEADLAISLEQLPRGLQASLFATAKERSRYAINGVL